MYGNSEWFEYEYEEWQSPHQFEEEQRIMRENAEIDLQNGQLLEE